MSEYREPIAISENDPICSATALNGTVIGILFEKTGEEIRNALQVRVGTIDEKVKGLRTLIDETDAFLLKKQEEIEKLDQFWQERGDEKQALLKPFHRERDAINKQRGKEIDLIREKQTEELNTVKHKRDAAESDFDKKTDKMVAEKAVNFEEDFQKFEASFEQIDDLLKDAARQASRTMMLRSVHPQGMTGPLGPQGDVGCQGAQGNQGWRDDGSEISSTQDSATYLTHIVQDEVDVPEFSEKEEKALARLHTLRSLVAEYTRKIEKIRGMINTLLEEKRRLALISRHLIDERKYKLDLNKLSAFGFEDIEMV
jgi:hypothetical protein